MKGFSSRNLKYMRSFAEAWPHEEFVQEVLAQLPWYHHLALLDKVKTPEAKHWYLQMAITHNWSRNVLVHHIETRLHLRSGQAISNFEKCLPPALADQAQALLKDPYFFDFLGIGEEAQERSIEEALVTQLTQFILELGTGFAYVGRQVHLEVGGEDFYLDLLFYHLKIHCYVVIELKAGTFKPEHAGKLNFYFSAIDAQMATEADGPSIGLLLCKCRNKLIVEYSLRDTAKPIGVAEYSLVQSLPQELKSSLPSVDDLERALSTFGA